MTSGKRVSIGLFGVLLGFVIIGGVISFSAASVLSDSQNLKDALNEARFYDRAAQAGLETAKTKAQTETSVPVNNPEIERVLQQSLQASDLQSQGESVIDSIYAWLEGRNDKLEFNLDFKNTRQNLADNLSAYAASRMESLPPCQTIPQETNPYLINCRPPALNIAQQRENLRFAILDNSSVLKEGNISANDLLASQSGEPATNSISNIPTYYQRLKLLPWIFGILAIIFAIAVFAVAKNTRTSCKTIGIALLSSGLLIVAVSFLAGFVEAGFRNFALSSAQANSLQTIVLDVVGNLQKDVNTAIFKSGIAFSAVGAMALVALKITRKNT